MVILHHRHRRRIVLSGFGLHAVRFTEQKKQHKSSFAWTQKRTFLGSFYAFCRQHLLCFSWLLFFEAAGAVLLNLHKLSRWRVNHWRLWLCIVNFIFCVCQKKGSVGVIVVWHQDYYFIPLRKEIKKRLSMSFKWFLFANHLRCPRAQLLQ